MHSVLFIEDNVPLRMTLHDAFPTQIYKTSSASTMAQAYAKLAAQKYDLLIIDRHLPDGDGLEIVRYLQKTQIDSAILMLTERGTERDRIIGLREGADDYLGKPFAVEELLLRSEKLVTKVKKISPLSLQIGDVELFTEKAMVRVGNRTVHLRRREFQILAFLMKHHGTIVTRQMLVDNLWGHATIPTYTTIDVYIRRVRMLLQPRQDFIQTVRTYGYIIYG